MFCSLFMMYDAKAACEFSTGNSPLQLSYGDYIIPNLSLPNTEKPSFISYAATENNALESDKTINAEPSSLWNQHPFFIRWSYQAESLTGYIELSAPVIMLTSATGGCVIRAKPVLSVSTISLNGGGYYAEYGPFYVGMEVNIPAGCTAGTYTGSLVIEGYFKSPEACPQGATATSTSVPVNLMITSAKGGTLGITEVQPMNFGAFFSPSATGTVTLPADSASPQYSGIQYYDKSTVKPGMMKIFGYENAAYALSIDSPEIQLYNTATPSQTLSLKNLHLSESEGVLGAGGNIVNVGGTLYVPANAPAGEYEGTYTIMLRY